MSAPNRAVPDGLLTLSVPLALQEELLDALLSHPELAAGFTLLPGFGMGTRVTLTTPMERVQGRARRVFVQVALAQCQLPTLLALLQRELQGAPVTYWMTPLLAFGRLGSQVDEA